MIRDLSIIDSFTAAAGYAYLSNFYQSTIYIDGKPYASIEHAYQSHKTVDESSRELIRRSKSPAEAKKLGRSLILREDWEQVKVPLMKSFLQKKFENPFLRPLLVGTADSELIYSNTWNDRFWGVCRGTGLNWLGKLLMQLREEIKIEEVEEKP